MFNWLKMGIVIGAVALTASCGGGDDDQVSSRNIVQTAQADPQFSTLVEAVVAADLGATLSAPGALTVFAPTNAAFAALLTELGVSKEALFANKPLLTAVLTYHVLPARVLRAGVPAGKAIGTVQGGIFKVDAVASGLQITDGRNRKANITATDLLASNGVIHVVDKVVLPADKNVVQTALALAAASPPQFTVLVEALVAAALTDTLSGSGPFTVFAPTDAAFGALLSELGISKASLLADKTLLTRVLTYHVVAGRALKADIVANTPITTVQGQTFTISTALAVTDQRGRSANIVGTDTLASNGVIHVIDRVVLPRP